MPAMKYSEFDFEQADAFMKRMSGIVSKLTVPACIAMSFGKDKFYIENPSMAKLSTDEKDTVYSGMNIAMISGLFDLSSKKQ